MGGCLPMTVDAGSTTALPITVRPVPAPSGRTVLTPTRFTPAASIPAAATPTPSARVPSAAVALAAPLLDAVPSTVIRSPAAFASPPTTAPYSTVARPAQASLAAAGSSHAQLSFASHSAVPPSSSLGGVA